MIYSHCVKVHRRAKKGKYEESDPTNASAYTSANALVDTLLTHLPTPQMCRLTHY